jgi:hypothetical protein
MANNPYLMVRSRSEYYTSMLVSGLPTFIVVQLTINIYSLPVSTANGIKFRFQFC